MQNGSLFLSRCLSYLRVGYLLHLVSLVEVALILSLYRLLDPAESPLVLPLALAPFFPQLDARSRFQNYKQLKDQFYLYGFDPRIVRPFVKSRCQRDAAIAAASDLGLGEVCKKHFYDKGYRWFHLLPDYLFTNPRFLACKAFWITTFFAKTYRPRIDFEKNEQPLLV